MESLVPPPAKLLVVDDEPDLRQMLQILFRREGYDVVTAPGYLVAAEAIRQSPQPFPVVLSDLSMPDGSGLDVLAAAKARSSATEVILITAHSTVENAIQAMKSGAYNFVTKPFEPSELAALTTKALEKHALVEENTRLKARISGKGENALIGKSAAMRSVHELIGRIADTRTTVLITGESGTGKERIARAIHESSERAEQPFLVVNCGALPEALMESELFGHEKGAFTGAVGRHRGIFREADGGTLLLDEVGELPLNLQVKLLRVLQERKVRPVGSHEEVPVDVRVLAATNREVEKDVAAGKFRQDLYYRLNVIRLELPPLNERKEDIAPLTERFLRRFAAEIGKDVRGLTPDAMRALESYAFPGNVRELENIIERAVALAGSRAIGLGDLPREVSGMSAGSGSEFLTLPQEGCKLDEVVNEVERRLLVEALERTGGVRKAAAELLGISFRSLRYRLEKHALDPEARPTDESNPSARGFTLVELLVVVALVGILATIGVMLVRRLVFESKTVEALAMVQSIRAAQERWRSENLTYLDVSQSGGWYPRDPSVAGVGRQKHSFFLATHADHAAWQRLNPTVSGPVQFGYQTRAGLPGTAMTTPAVDVGLDWPSNNDSWYVIQAIADADGDGNVAFYLASSLNGEVFRQNEGE